MSLCLSVFSEYMYIYLYRFLNTFKYVNLRAKEEADRVGIADKEYIWPQSFPDCTPELRKFH